MYPIPPLRVGRGSYSSPRPPQKDKFCANFLYPSALPAPPSLFLNWVEESRGGPFSIDFLDMLSISVKMIPNYEILLHKRHNYLNRVKDFFLSTLLFFLRH